MGTYIGIIAKKSDLEKTNFKIFSIGETVELVNILDGIEHTVNWANQHNVINDKFSEIFTDAEIKALKISETGEYPYYKLQENTKEELINSSYYAIDIFTNDDFELTYSDKHEYLENWSNSNIIEDALIKVQKILRSIVNNSIKNNNQMSLSDHFLYDYEKLNYLLGAFRFIKQEFKPVQCSLYSQN
jgi:hypothetical protein